MVQLRVLARHCVHSLLESPLPESARSEALISIAAGGVAAQALFAADHGPQAFAATQFRLLEQLVDLIIPDSDAPGARKAGAARRDALPAFLARLWPPANCRYD